MSKVFKNIYAYVVTLPERLYPFSCTIRGKRVRGRRAYERAVARALKKNSLAQIGYKILLYRELFHFIGSIMFIFFATILSKKFLGSDMSLYMLFLAAIIALSYQEFYLHPKRYGQHAQKGIIDWLVWVLPMALYLFR